MSIAVTEPSAIRHERGGGGGEPGAESPHDAQRTNGAADSGHMSVNPLRPLNASLPFHYSTPFRRPRSPPPRHSHFPFASSRTSTPVTLPRGGGATPALRTPRPSLPPPHLLSAFFFSRFPLAAGLMNSSAPAGPSLQLFTRRTPSKRGSVIRRGLTPENPAKSRQANATSRACLLPDRFIRRRSPAAGGLAAGLFVLFFLIALKATSESLARYLLHTCSPQHPTATTPRPRTVQHAQDSDYFRECED